VQRGDDHLLHEACVTEAHQRLRRVHVGIDVRRGQHDGEDGERKAIARQQWTVRREHRLHERRVAHGTAVHDDDDIVAAAACEVGRTCVAAHVHTMLVTIHR
jgi:hypothetical protein